MSVTDLGRYRESVRASKFVDAIRPVLREHIEELDLPDTGKFLIDVVQIFINGLLITTEQHLSEQVARDIVDALSDDIRGNGHRLLDSIRDGKKK